MRRRISKGHILIIAGLAALLPLVLATAVGARGAFRADSGSVAQLAAHTDAAQAAALGDGFVSIQEYESAVTATIACMRKAGIPVSDPQWMGHQLRFTYGGYASRTEIEAAGEVYADCHTMNQAAIDRVWARQQTGARPDTEAIADYYELMRECTGAAEATFRAVVAAAQASGDPSLLERCHTDSADAAEIPDR
jgi:hypothetical protein